jgi:hypothetical protein
MSVVFLIPTGGSLAALTLLAFLLGLATLGKGVPSPAGTLANVG